MNPTNISVTPGYFLRGNWKLGTFFREWEKQKGLTGALMLWCKLEWGCRDNLFYSWWSTWAPCSFLLAVPLNRKCLCSTVFFIFWGVLVASKSTVSILWNAKKNIILCKHGHHQTCGNRCGGYWAWPPSCGSHWWAQGSLPSDKTKSVIIWNNSCLKGGNTIAARCPN